MAKFNLKIVTPEELVFDNEVEMVIVPTTQGLLGILPHHANLMAKLAAGELKIKDGDKTESFTIGDGFLQVAESGVTVVTDLAVSEKAGTEALKKARELREERLADFEYADTIASLEKSLKT